MDFRGLGEQQGFLCRLTVVFLTLLLTMLPVSATQGSEIPAELQLQLFAKILTFDHNFKSRTGDKLILGIVYQNKVPESMQARKEFEFALASDTSTRIKGLKIQATAIRLGDPAELERRITAEDIDLLYIAPLRSVDISEIAAIAQRHQVVTLSAVPDYVREGLALGLFLREERPRILINLKSARAEGADISSQVLKLAEVIQ